MAIPHVVAGSVAESAAQNDLIDQCNSTVTRLNSYDAVSSALVPTTNNDFLLYGDQVSNAPRNLATYAEDLSNGFLSASATRVGRAGVVNSVRVCTLTAATGSGTFDISLYRGSSLSNMSLVQNLFGGGNVTSTGVKTLNLSAALTLNYNEYVGVALIVTGWTTVPYLASTYNNAPASAANFINQGTNTYSVYRSGQTFPPPTTLNMTDVVYTKSSSEFWFALV
ncbi:hypothetical protein [Saccharopolyspora hattusasensis]|uniref:hypothetical protein n=1 Tax=Saccharopolyspora hattusasensis TaxID=1128679 RepID=UPI003D997F97